MAGSLIKAGKYNEKVRDFIRDFYAYGWKSTSDMEGSAAGISGDVKRLREAIIDENIQWYGWDGEAFRSRTLSLSVDSHRPKTNPFHRAFWYCTHSSNDLINFFGIMLLLSRETTLVSDGMVVPGLFFNENSGVEEDSFDEIRKWYVQEKESLGALPNKAIRLFLIQQNVSLGFGFDDNENAVLTMEANNGDETIRLDDYNSVRRRMEEYRSIGVAEHSDGGRKTKGDKEGEHWRLSGCRLNELLKVGRSCDPEFDAHWKKLLSFYSRCFIFGEIGTGLLRRTDSEPDASIHVLDDYYMQSLSDFVLYDLLDAIEKDCWCLIRYKKGNQTENHIVKPLHVRVGLTNGRQHLFAFNVNNRQMENLLLSSVSSVEIIDSYSDILEAYRKKGASVPSEEEIGPLIRAKASIVSDLWGVSIPGERDGETVCENVSITFDCEPDDMEDLLQRLEREKRCGQVLVENGHAVFRADVADGRELIPWIRKYYGGIASVSGINPAKYCAEEDVKSMIGVMNEGFAAMPVLPGRTSDMNLRNDYATDIEPKSHSSEAHNTIFHECFSEEFFVAADWLTRILFGRDYRNQSEWTFEEMRKVYDRVCEDRAFHTNQGRDVAVNDDVERLFDELIQLVDETRIFRMVRNNRDKRMGSRKYVRMLRNKHQNRETSDGEATFYKDIFPLTIAERRWLASILTDEKCTVFLCEETIRELLVFIDAKPFLTDRVVFYDRPCSMNNERLQEHLGACLSAIREGKKVLVRYMSRSGAAEIAAAPSYIEYSKREDTFRVVLETQDDGESEARAGTVAIDAGKIQVIAAINSENATKPMPREADATNRRELKINFVDAKNLAERLFTEMAPWDRQTAKMEKKVSFYDSLDETDKSYDQFVMQLRYDDADIEKLVEKMLAVGPYLRLTEKTTTGNGVASEYKRRLERQRQLLKKRMKNQ